MAAEGRRLTSADPAPPRRRTGAFGVLASLVAVVAIVLWARAQPAPRWPGSASQLLLLVLALGVYAVATAVRGWRWHAILRRAGVAHRRRDAWGLVVVGYMGNTVLPARGGEVLRVVLLSQRSSASKTDVVASIIAERSLDAVVLAALFVVLTWVGIAGAPTGQLPAALAAVALLGMLAAAALWVRLRARGRLDALARRLRPLFQASRPLLGRHGAVLGLATAAVWGMEGVVFVLVARSLELDIGLLDGLFLDVLASFFALIPAAPGYVGTFDAAMLFGLHGLDVGGGSAVSFAILVRFILFVPITVAGGALMLWWYGGWSSVRRSLRRSR